MEHQYLGTLIHEMLHGFLAYHICECQTCRANFAPSLGGSGPGGHGPTWANSILEIALAIQDHVSWRVHTGLYSSVRGDMWNHNWRATKDK
jgi:hypothetical protein